MLKPEWQDTLETLDDNLHDFLKAKDTFEYALAQGSILEYRLTFEDGMVTAHVKPRVPVEFVTLNFLVSKNGATFIPGHVEPAPVPGDGEVRCRAIFGVAPQRRPGYDGTY